jgi:hypothetical protein
MGSGGKVPRIRNLGTLDGREWWASCSGHFTPDEIAPATHWIGGRVGLKACLDAVARGGGGKKHHFPCRESNVSSPARSVVMTLTEVPSV